MEVFPIKESRSWSKPDNIPGLIARKKVDWSIFEYGSHIPLIFHEDFEEANQSRPIEVGTSKKLELNISDKRYDAILKKSYRSSEDNDVLELTYSGNSELTELFKKTFKTTYNYLKDIRENQEKGSRKIHIVPEEMAEYIEFYKTDEPFKYKLKLITANSDSNLSDRNNSLLAENNTKEIIEHINKYIRSKGFTYPEGLIENFYLSLKTKPFVLLAGISGTGKTKLVQLFAEALSCRYKLISVRPDWSDGSDLLGYKNIQGKFLPGPMIDFIKEAKEDPDNIYFLCLDEMNLARVEYYFSDFLSIMETRKKVANGIITDKLIDRNYFEKEEDRVYEDLVLPDNLYLVGTVNMDETTHPFSKKVLDRANTIEFSAVYLDNYRLKDALEIELDNNPVRVNNNFLIAEYLTLNDCSQEDEEIIVEVIGKLNDLNDILQEANLQVAYRVRDEVCFYLLYNQQEELLEENTAFDFQLMQKILPRIQGSGETIKRVLIKLFGITAGRDFSKEDGEIGNLAIDYVKANRDLL